MNTNTHTHGSPRGAPMRARPVSSQPTPRGPHAALALVRAGPALRWAWALPWLGVWRAFGLLGDGPASCWAFVRQASSDAYSYDALPIKFPVPEFISDTNNI